MNKIMMSIKPQYVAKIFNGEKTIEIRRTHPSIDMPFKVYVYCTKERMTKVPSMYAYLHKNEPRACAEYGTIETWGKIGDVIVNPHLASMHVSFGMHGKVIGEFVCDKVEKITPSVEWGSHGYDTVDDDLLKEMRLERGYLENYGSGVTLYGWHITEPKLFDKPRELCEFCVPCKEYDSDKPRCGECDYYKYSPNDSGDAQEECLCEGSKPLRRPPISWCRVEDKKEVGKYGA